MDYYDHIAGAYDELHSSEQSEKAGIVSRGILPRKNEKVLDVGCGTGISSRFECAVVGIDPSIESLKVNKSRNKVNGVAESLPFRDGCFDYVISVTAIHNFSEIGKSLAEMKRVGRKKFVFSVLKKSKKLDLIKKSILNDFEIKKVVEEDKDLIYFCEKKSATFI